MKRTVFNGRFQIKEVTIGFEQGIKIEYSNGKIKTVMSPDGFAKEIMEVMKFVENLNKPGGPVVKIQVEVQDE